MNSVQSLIVTGASSALGDVVMPRIAEIYPNIVVVARSNHAGNWSSRHNIRVVQWDLESRSAPPRVAATHVLHMAGIRHAATALALARTADAEHIVAISSASATADEHPNRGWIRANERVLATAEIRATILRPTMIYGSPRDRNIRRLYSILTRMPAIPHFVGGGIIMPVLADDLASAIEESLRHSHWGTLPVAGPVPLTFGQVVDAVARVGQMKHLPVTVPMRMVTSLAKRFPPGSGGLTHALAMLATDRVVDAPTSVGFAYSPTDFDEGLRIALPRYDSGEVI